MQGKRLMASQTLYLTFDDGPDPDWTPRILDALAAAQMTATFFAVGRYAQQHSALLRRTAAEGHGIGNHTWSHRHPLYLTERAARCEVADGAKALSDILGAPATLYRPPHGRVRRCMVEEAEAQGQQLVLWTLSAVDWGLLGTARGIARRLRHAGSNDIVLMHDGKRGINRTVQLWRALPSFLETLIRRDLRSRAFPSLVPSKPRRLPNNHA